MSVYAKLIMEKLPGSCAECKMGNKYGLVGDVKCSLLNTYFTGNVEPPHKERPDECPLAEISEKQARELVEQLRKRGLSNGSCIGHHSGLYDEAADMIAGLMKLQLSDDQDDENDEGEEDNCSAGIYDCETCSIQDSCIRE